MIGEEDVRRLIRRAHDADPEAPEVDVTAGLIDIQHRRARQLQMAATTRSESDVLVAASPAPVRTTGYDWAESTLLGSLGAASRKVLLETGTTAEFPDGRRLIEQGAADDHTYLLVRGTVKVAARDHLGRSALLGIRLAGDLVGEMAALDRPPTGRTMRSADVTTCGPVVAKVIKSAELHTLMRREPEISLCVVRMVTSRLRWASERRVDVASRARTRVARVLYEVIRGYGSPKPTHWELGVPLIQSEIASLSGVGLRTVQKSLRELAAAGVLIRRYGTIHVTDLDALRRIAEI